MRSSLQQGALLSVGRVLLPLARLMLRCGLGCSEFVALTKAAFVQAATQEYGLRGRPTNISRVAAMTGLSRKEVRRIRDVGSIERWTPDMELTPTNTVIHFWHFDPAFSETPGAPRPLSVDGDASFAELVRKYAGDIPPGAMRKELLRAGTVTEDDAGNLCVRARYFTPGDFDEDFVRNAAFALRSLGDTLVYNATLAAKTRSGEAVPSPRRFERFAWTDRLTSRSIEALQQWVHTEGTSFVEAADTWIGEHESASNAIRADERRTVGVGVYYFEDEES
jgi:hypothetical protein